MKKLLVVLMIMMMASFAFADTGWFSDYIVVNGDWFWIGGDPDAHIEFNGYDFGTVSSLNITQAEMKYWSDNQDRTGGAFYWQIRQGETEISALNEVIWTQTGLGGNDYQGDWTGSKNAFEGLTTSANGKTYDLHIWAKSWGSSQGDSWLSNNSANYKATFTISGVTPITLASFTATAKKGTVEIAWTTASETENSHFLVYRDGDEIAQVDGAGTTSETNDYLVVDETVVPGVHTYSLIDVSFAGDVVEHEAVEVVVGADLSKATFALNNAYPNPFNPRTAISYELSAVSDLNLSIYNTAGVLVETLFNGEHAAGSHEINWNASNMPSGVYIVSMLAGNTLQSQKIVLMK